MKQAIIVDIDGTIAIRNPEGNQLDRHGNDKVRSIHDYSRVSEDQPCWPIINLINDYLSAHPHVRVLITTGRPETCFDDTWNWLRKYIQFDKLIMRPEGDFRGDDIVKQELYDEHIKPEYEVLYAFDDRNRVVDMWRRNSITTLQVAFGDF